MLETAVVTGASRGIGRAAARLLAERGYAVAICYRAAECEATELENELVAAGKTALSVRMDVAERTSVQRAFVEIEERLPPVTALVNNAGIAGQKLFTDITPDEWDEMFRVNVTGMFHTTQRALPGMLSRKSGAIVNVSSVWGVTGASMEVHYSAAKAAVIGFTKALAKEVGPSGIRVNCVAPGVIETDMLADLTDADRRALADDTPLSRLGTAADVARTIAFLVSKEAAFLTGQVLSPNGGFLI